MTTVALLNALLPGDNDFPKGEIIADAIAAHERFSIPLAAILAILPSDLSAFSPGQRIVAIHAAEVAHPTLFGSLIIGVYSLYYTHPAVAEVIERLTGHSAAPPQPKGHNLAAFDLSLVAVPAVRAPHYRPTPKASS